VDTEPLQEIIGLITRGRSKRQRGRQCRIEKTVRVKNYDLERKKEVCVRQEGARPQEGFLTTE